MTSEMFQGVSLDDQIRSIEDESELLDKRKKELKELKELCGSIEIEVINELEKKHNFKEFNENMSDFFGKFDDFLDSLNDYIKTGSETSKASLLEKIPILKDINSVIRDIGDG